MLFLAAVLAMPADAAAQPARPNIVLMFPDNLGWGEVGAYGGVRGQLTPRLDKLAAEGIRLNNFNVEFSCTVSRAALMTGRYAIRTGATQPGGITLWEVTIAEALKSVGYATALFGKWHLGGDRPEGKREPSHQGFDEFYGIPRTSNEAQTTIAQGQTTPGTSFIWEGKAGEPSRNVKPFDMDTRRTIDRESAERGIAFMERSVTRAHAVLPLLPDDADSLSDPRASRFRRQDRRGRHRRRDGRDGRQRRPRARRASIGSADRAATRSCCGAPTTAPSSGGPWRGSSGPWSGFYNTVMEGGIRTPCIIRWPGRIPAGRVVERDRPRDRSLPDARGRRRRRHRAQGSRDRRRQPAAVPRRQAGRSRAATACSSSPTTQVRAVKWHDWKLHYTYQPEAGAPPVPPLMRLFNLLSDPKEETDIKDANPWAQGVMDKIVADFMATTTRYPHVPPNAPDPYVPAQEAPTDRLMLRPSGAFTRSSFSVHAPRRRRWPPSAPPRVTSMTRAVGDSSDSRCVTSVVKGFPGLDRPRDSSS